jgi:hypothetical protein
MNRPRRLDPLAERVLELLSGRPETGSIILGGYLALQHHVDYRTSHDIAAWWSDRADPVVEDVIRQVNLLLHLAGLESRRPVERIADPAAREQARRVRQWFRDVFVRP